MPNCSSTSKSLENRSSGSVTHGESAPPLTAEQSDPQSLGWMQDFPPPEDRIIRFSDSDYSAFQARYLSDQLAAFPQIYGSIKYLRVGHRVYSSTSMIAPNTGLGNASFVNNRD